MWCRDFVKSFLMGLVVTLLPGCRKGVETPAVKILGGSRTVTVNDSVWFRCVVEAQKKPALTFHWWCTAGNLSVTEGDSVRWVAPDSSGFATVGVAGFDTNGNETRDSIEVAIEPRSVTFVFWEGAVKAGDFVFFCDSARARYRLHGWSQADTGSTYLLFLDEPNFLRWNQGQGCEFMIRRLAYISSPFYDTIPASGVYYLVMDNTRGLTDVSFRVEIRLISP